MTRTGHEDPRRGLQAFPPNSNRALDRSDLRPRFRTRLATSDRFGPFSRVPHGHAIWCHSCQSRVRSSGIR